MRAHQKKNQSGQVIVIFALFLFVLVAAIGLAIDSGMGYLSKAKLNSAVDAAAIAAARAAIKGDTQAEQTASATEAAREFFAVNYPTNYLQSTAVLDSTSVGYANGKITIDVAATATLPTSFMRVANVNELVIRAGAETVRKDLDLAFVIDTSGSMDNPVTQDRVRQASKSFLDKLNAVTDRVSLIQFASGAQVRQPFKASQARGFERGTMKGTIDAFDFEGATNSAEGLWHARDQLKNAIASPSSLRFIVFFSDGSPNTFASRFKFSGASTCNTSPGRLRTGSIVTGDGTSLDGPHGLFDHASTNIVNKDCYLGEAIAGADGIPTLPDWYNAHGGPSEFPVVTGTPRNVVADMSNPDTAWKNVNRASRNLAEAIAQKARQEGIMIFTIGLGNLLGKTTGPDGENGEAILKCLANLGPAGSRCNVPSEPAGLYCNAFTDDQLVPCFDQVASAILRLTR